jgi:hypothetical protein
MDESEPLLIALVPRNPRNSARVVRIFSTVFAVFFVAHRTQIFDPVVRWIAIYVVNLLRFTSLQQLPDHPMSR